MVGIRAKEILPCRCLTTSWSIPPVPLVLVLVPLTLASLPHRISQAESACQIDERSASILAAHIQVAGGDGRLRELKSRRIVGQVVKHGVGIRTEILHAAPNLSLTKTFFPRPGTLVQGFDGKQAWIAHPVRGPLLLTSDQQQAIRDDSWFDRVDSVERVFSEVRYERFDADQNTEILEMRKGTAESKWHFDRDTKLLSMIERQIDLGPRGTAKIRVHFEDYRETDGVRMPWRIRTVAPRDETVLVVEKIELNVEVTNDTFKSVH